MKMNSQITGKLLLAVLIGGLVGSPQLAWGQDLEILFQQAEQARQNGEYEKAEQIWRQIIERDPHSAPAYLGLGNRLRDQDKIAEAIAAYERAIELDPNYAFAYVGLGNAWRSQNQLTLAKTQYERAIELNPNLPGVYWNLGNVLADLGEVEKAIAQFRIVIKLAPDFMAVYNDLGAALLAVGNVEEAIGIYNQAIGRNSPYVATYTGLGNAWRQKGQIAQAIAAYQKAINLDGFEVEAYQGLAEIYYEQKNWEQAISTYEILVNLKPNEQAYLALGYAWQQQGKLAEAIAAYENAVTLNPDGVLAHYNLQESKRSLALEQASQDRNDNNNQISENSSPLAPIARIITPIRNGVNIGTGWVVQRQEDRALVVTNREAIAYASSLANHQIQVEFLSPSSVATPQPRYGAKLIHITPKDAKTNLVVLQVTGIPDTIQPLQMNPKIENSEVKIVGHPFNANPWTITTGKLDLRSFISNEGQNSLKIQANLTQGYAGSPILNQDGQAIAMVSYIGEKTDSDRPLTPAIAETGLIVPIALIQEQLEAWGIFDE